MEEKDFEIVSGIVENIKYKNEETGYTVCNIECNNELITVVGRLPFVCVGEEIKAQGRWTLHASYGRQFMADSCEKHLPVNSAAIMRYLSSGAVKGIGPVTASRIVDIYGDKSLEVLEESPEKLSIIRGISREKANKMSENFKQQFGVRSLLIFFQSYGITPSLALKIWKRWGSRSVDIIKENPYILCDEIYGVGFLKSDEIAAQMGISQNSPFRLRTGIKYVLNHNLTNGHTFLPRQKLIEAACEMLDAGIEQIEDNLDELIAKGELNEDKNIKNIEAVYLSHYYRAESFAADRLIVLANVKEKDFTDAEKYIDEIEKANGIKYAKMQREAIEQAMRNRVMILTGGPGTGKTTALKAMISIFEKLELKTALAAPTGRAAKRMEELTGKEAKTIHRLLEMGYTNEHIPRFARNENNPLEYDVIIIDEVSMVDIMLMEALLKAMPLSCRLIMVGDADQLPPVGAGNVLRDMIKSEVLPVVRLDEIFRQAQESLIVVNAHRINKGEYPDLSRKDKDFFFIKKETSEEVLQTVEELSGKRLPNAYNFSPIKDIQIISPTRKATTGTAVLNERLRELFNPASERKKEKKVREIVFREGDKVMQMRNDYDIVWQRDTGESGTGIFNGDIGVIESIDFEFEGASIRFDDRTASYEFTDLEEIEPAYAITVHKSQGSEFNAVILPLFDGPSRLFYRSLLYTAVTRAKQLVIIVGSENKVREMVMNNESSGRYTGLRYLLQRGQV